MKAPVLFRSPAISLAMHPVRDIGIGGLRVSCTAPLRVNEEHTVGLVLPSGRELRCRVRVAWSGRSRGGDHEAGLQIIGAESDMAEVWQVLEEHAEPSGQDSPAPAVDKPDRDPPGRQVDG